MQGPQVDLVGRLVRHKLLTVALVRAVVGQQVQDDLVGRIVGVQSPLRVRLAAGGDIGRLTRSYG